MPDARRWKEEYKTPVMQSAPGDSIEDYPLEKKLGQGATGAVHKAHALRGRLRGRTVAVKIVIFTGCLRENVLTV